MGTLASITDSTFDEEVGAASGVTVVDFWATWCGPCRMLEPTLERVAAERSDVRIVKINNDENMKTAARFGVRGLPTLLVFKDGKAVDQLIGAVNQDKINAVLDKHV
jgi:thioredoxin 1